LPRRVLLFLSFALCISLPAHPQAPSGTLTDHEVEALRDAAYIPTEHIRAYESILNDRTKELDNLLDKRHSVDFPEDMHDVMDGMGAIADELNDHLDDYAKRNRDLRKILPKLIESTERWSTALRAPADDSHYDVVRKVALDAIKDTRALAEGLATDQAAYFKDHPEAARAEKDKAENPHAPQ
jgi:hypothetical protein